MTILVTGATGFLGRHLCAALRRSGQEVVALGSREADLTDQRSLDPYSGKRFEKIYHLACWTQAGDFCLRHPGEQWVINQRINTNVLGWWQARQPQAKLISMGTSCAYAEGSAHREDEYLIGQPTESLFTYAMTKRMLHVGQMSIGKQFGLSSLTVVPSTLYGTGYQLHGRQMHFIFDLAIKILRKKHLDQPVVLWGDGLQRREVVHVDDFVVTLLAVDTRLENDVVNIGAGTEHSLREFAHTLCELAGVDAATITWDTDRYVGARAKHLDCAKIDALVPARPRRPLREGLKELLAWLEAEGVVARP